MSTCCGLDQSFDFIAHRTALCYEPVVSEATGEAKQTVKDISGLSTRIKPTTGFVLPMSGPTLLIKSHDFLGFADAVRAQAPCVP